MGALLGVGKYYEIRLQQIAKDIAMHRTGTVDDVAYAILFLASDKSSYITGSELNIDGGILAGSTASPGITSSGDKS